ncbi:MAG TPA: chemotaxis protein CheW [Spirochaetota bacterium]|nr:chemotaxis protein CheW [Spirochaetota bacterium]
MNEDNSTSVQYLSFILDQRVFAFDVLKTREVLTFDKVTPIPCSAAYVAGVINLRGSVVTVMDLRVKFGMKAVEHNENTAIIIVEAMYGEDKVVVGALVDAVKGVLHFEPNQIEPPPRVGMKLNAELITGIGKTNNDFVVILNVDKVLSEEDLSLALQNSESSGKAAADVSQGSTD